MRPCIQCESPIQTKKNLYCDECLESLVDFVTIDSDLVTKIAEEIIEVNKERISDGDLDDYDCWSDTILSTLEEEICLETIVGNTIRKMLKERADDTTNG